MNRIRRMKNKSSPFHFQVTAWHSTRYAYFKDHLHHFLVVLKTANYEIWIRDLILIKNSLFSRHLWHGGELTLASNALLFDCWELPDFQLFWSERVNRTDEQISMTFQSTKRQIFRRTPSPYYHAQKMKQALFQTKKITIIHLNIISNSLVSIILILTVRAMAYLI